MPSVCVSGFAGRSAAILPRAVELVRSGHWRHGRRATEGRCVTGLHQVAPGLSSPGRRFRAYTAKHLDELTERVIREAIDEDISEAPEAGSPKALPERSDE